MRNTLCSRRFARRALLAVPAVLALLSLPSGALAAKPVSVKVMVVGKGGRVLVPARQVTLTAKHASVSGHRCQIGALTPLGALESLAGLRGEHGLRPSLAQFASGCAPNGIYLKALDRQAGRGYGGWCYKVGDRQPEAGVASPEAPRLRTGDRVLFYYCEYTGEEAQDTLDFAPVPARIHTSGELHVKVYSFTTSGKRRAATGAHVRLGADVAITNEAGEATVKVSSRPGVYRLHATLAGSVPAFERLIRASRG
jgi:hypothetical protein